MIQHPAIIALLTVSYVTAALLVYAAWHGSRIRRAWDIASGSELQLTLERRTYLISAILEVTLMFQFLSLFLFIFTADALNGRLAGAMCAAGTLNANAYGYPALLLKIVSCLAAGVWLIINHADTRGYDYPLIRQKYAFLNLLAVLLLVEALVSGLYFSRLKPDVITSCCGSLFSQGGNGLAGEMASLPAETMRLVFFGTMAATIAGGALFIRSGRGGRLFSLASSLAFVVSVASLVSFVCLYIYELPTHHCPFCILQKEYGYVGYLLYATLLGGGIAGVGVGALTAFGKSASLERLLPAMQRRLAMVTVSLYLLFTVLVLWKMFFTDFRLEQ